MPNLFAILRIIQKLRNLEKLIVAASSLATLWLLLLPQARIIIPFVLAVLVLIALHAWIERMHWQMIPAYTAGLLLLACAMGLPSQSLSRQICAAAAIALLLCSCALSWVLPMFRLPEPTGRFPVGTRIMDFADPSRREMHAWAPPGQRELVAQLWYPARDSRGPKAVYRRPKETSILSSYQAVLNTQSIEDAEFASGRFPIVMFNHAWGGFRNRSTFLAQELASHGFVVVAVSHTYNSRSVELPGGRIAYNQKEIDIGFWATLHIPLKERLDLADTELRIHTDDCNFVLQQLSEVSCTSGHWLEKHLDTNRIGSIGQSFGGAVAAQLAKENPSVRSALSLDGVIHGNLLTESFDKPIMFLDSIWLTELDLDENNPNIVIAETALMWKMIADAKKRILRASGGFHIVIQGTQHQDFTDAGFMSPLRALSHIGPLPPERSAAIINAYALAFLRQTLCESEEPILADGAQPFPEAALIVWHGLATEQPLCAAAAAGNEA